MFTSKRLSRLVVVLLLLGAAAPTVAAQQAPGTETAAPGTDSAPTAMPAGGSGGGETNANPNAGAGGGGNSGGGAWGMAKGVISGGYEDVQSGVSSYVAGVIDTFNGATLALPAPGEADSPMSWVQVPEDSWWATSQGIYDPLSKLLLPVLGAAGVFALTRGDEQEGREQARKALKCGGWILAGEILLPLALHGGNILSLGIAPSGAEFMSTPGNVAKLGVGLVLGVGLGTVKIGIVGVGAVVLFVQWFAVHFLYAVWPLLMTARASGVDTLESIGRAGASMFVFLIGLKVLQALLLRFLFGLPMTVDGEGLQTLIATIVGVGIAFIVLPVWGTKKVVPRAVNPVGSGLHAAGGNLSERVRERAPDRDALVGRVSGSRRSNGEDGRGRESPSTDGSDARVGRAGNGARREGSARRAQIKRNRQKRRRSRASRGSTGSETAADDSE